MMLVNDAVSMNPINSDQDLFMGGVSASELDPDPFLNVYREGYL